MQSLKDSKLFAMAAALALSLQFAGLTGCFAEARENKASDHTVKSRVLRVGAGRELSRPSAAARIARDGDIVEIDTGVYESDVAVWKQNGLIIRGVGGRAHLRANGTHAEGKGIWVIKGADTTIESIEFSGATVKHRNGAGIRLEGPGLVVRNCYFHDNENGILTGAHPESDILIENSEFSNNGFGDGYSHNMYIGKVRSFTLRYSYVHHAVVGHNVKSRALRNEIVYNRIMDENDGRSSYAIDLPNGGLSYVIGNLIQQGPRTENDAIVAYGAEGMTNPRSELYFASNTVVNDFTAPSRFVFVHGEPDAAVILNNIFSGQGETLNGLGRLLNNVRLPKSDFVDAAAFDYRLKAGSSAIGAAIGPKYATGFDLRPSAEYVHKARSRARRKMSSYDVGAIAYRGAE